MNFKEWYYLHESKTYSIKFSDVKFDTTEKYYVDIDKSTNNVDDISKVDLGDKVADWVMSNAEYWRIVGVDDQKRRLYLEPIGKNPYVPNVEGEVVGAGGKVFDQHDFDVLSGKYESEKIDKILEIINNKEYHDIRDIAYILLGTVPVQVGPNGSQGGWYSVGDTSSNRGGKKGMKTEEIMMKDADTLKNKLGFDVPRTALDGTLKPSNWNDFVGGHLINSKDLENTKLEIEDFNDAEKMANIVLSHAQPAIRQRNALELLQLSRNDDAYDSIVRDVAFQLAKQSKITHNLDYLWLVKEHFIKFAKEKGWDDVLEAFIDSHDQTNRKYVAESLLGLGKIDQVLKMLDKEPHEEAISRILSSLFSTVRKIFEDEPHMRYLYNMGTQLESLFESNPEIKEKVKAVSKPIIECINRNKRRIKSILNSSEDGYYAKDINNYIDLFGQLEKILFS